MARFGCRLRDGRSWGCMPFKVEDNATSLVEGYDSALLWLLQQRTGESHDVFLDDGTFVIRARWCTQGVQVQVGEFCDFPLLSDQGDPSEGVAVSKLEYKHFWKCIAAALSCASNEHSPVGQKEPGAASLD